MVSCVCNIWTDVKLLLYLSMQGGNVSIAGCPMKRAIRLCHGWYGVWSTLRTCEQIRFPWFSFSSVSVSRRRGMGLSRKPHLPNISSISLSSCCGMAPAIWMGRSTNLFFSVGLWSDLCRDVRNALWFDFILRRTTQARVSCHVVSWWDSAPNRSLQWSFSCLAWFPCWLRQGAMDPCEIVWGNPLHGDCRPSDCWIYNFQCGNSSK